MPPRPAISVVRRSRKQHAAHQIEVRDDDDVMEDVEDGPSECRWRQEAETRRRVADVADQVEREDPAEIAFVQRRDQSDHHRRRRHRQQEREQRRRRALEQQREDADQRVDAHLGEQSGERRANRGGGV